MVRPPRPRQDGWIRDPVTAAGSALSNGVGGTAGNIGDGLSNAGNDAADGLRDAGNNVADGLRDAGGSARDALIRAGRWVMQYFCDGCNCIAVNMWVEGVETLYRIATNHTPLDCLDGGFRTPFDMPDLPRPRSDIHDGWAQCQYFVYISPLRHDLTLLDAEQDMPRRWVRGPFPGEGLIIPVHGPIVDIVVEQNAMGSYDLYLICSGLGVAIVNYFAFRPPGRVYPYNLEAQNFLGSMTNENSTFVVDGLQPVHAAIWTHSRNVFFVPETGKRYTSSEVQKVLIARSVGPNWELSDIRPAWTIPEYTYTSGRSTVYGRVCNPPPPPPPPPPPRSTGGDDPPMCCRCDQIATLIDAKLRPIYSILGFPQGSDSPSISLAPETRLKDFSRSLYGSGNTAGSAQVNNIIELIASIGAIDYARSGFNRFPATFPKLLTKSRVSAETVQINDSVSLMEWLIKQVDALIGQFPVVIKLKDAEENVTELKLDNIAEALAELVGLSLATASDVDFTSNMALRATIEAARAGNAAMVAQDYAKANAQYLGYKGNPKERTIKVSFNPNSTDKDEIIQPSNQKIIGWEWEGNDSLQATLNQLLLAAGIIKAALVQKWEPGDDVTGDAIKDLREEESDQQQDDWTEYLARRANPPADREIPNAPPIHIRDLSHGQDS